MCVCVSHVSFAFVAEFAAHTNANGSHSDSNSNSTHRVGKLKRSADSDSAQLRLGSECDSRGKLADYWAQKGVCDDELNSICANQSGDRRDCPATTSLGLASRVACLRVRACVLRQAHADRISRIGNTFATSAPKPNRVRAQPQRERRRSHVTRPATIRLRQLSSSSLLSSSLLLRLRLHLRLLV